MMLAAEGQLSIASLGSGSGHSGTVGQIGEHMLHRMDLLSAEARTHINLGAILGPAFESADVVSIMERYRGIGASDRDGHRESVLNSLVQAVHSGILEEDLTGAGNSMSFTGPDNFQSQESITYKFTHDDWRHNILKVILDSWKRDMYMLLATSLEARFDFKSRRPDREIRKLFDPFKGGKNKGKNISVASELALKIGEKMTRNGKGRYSIRIYQMALDHWLKAEDGKDILMIEGMFWRGCVALRFRTDIQFVLFVAAEDNDLSPTELEGEDLEYVLKLNAAMGRCSLLLMDKDKSLNAFQANLDVSSTTVSCPALSLSDIALTRIIPPQLVPDSKDLKEPASIFPSFSGRFYTLRLARKVDYEPEIEFVFGFVEEAEAHKNPIHQLQALAMEAEIFGRKGECGKSLEACQELRNLYNAATHSPQLVDFYRDDYCAQCIAQSASWHMQLSQYGKAQEVCDYVVSILHTLNGTDCFLALYPILWVLKDLPGQADRALRLCHDYLPVKGEKRMSSTNADSDGGLVVEESDVNEIQSRDEGQDSSFSPFRVLHRPITMLMVLSAKAPDDETIVEFADRTVKSKDEFDKAFNMYTASIGRNADSITAEICLQLATYEVAASYKTDLLQRASSLVASSMKLTKYMPAAYEQVKGFAYDKRFRGL
jgi:hypothetical protein